MLKKITLFLVLSMGQNSMANNIQISNITLTGQNIASDFTMVQFSLEWENSWRVSVGPSNWDAAWIFVKYRVGTGPWLHAFLNDTGHNTGTGTAATITSGLMNSANAFGATSNPAMGVFVHRSEVSAGPFTQTNLQIRWNYGNNGIPEGQAVDIKVFAVEMVYVPSGAFQVGDGNVAPASYQGQFTNIPTTSPRTISSEATLTLGGTTSGNLGNNENMGVYPADDFMSNTTQTLPAAFPKGYNAFYCMKYEISQGQYRDFLNVLTYGQQVSRTATLPTSASGMGALVNNNSGRNGIDVQTSGNATTSASALYGCNLNGDVNFNDAVDGENLPCNFLTWMDGAAFADWASLRPMTELEFEKACRGTLTPVANEFALGTTSFTAPAEISLSGQNNEVASNISLGANLNTGNNVNIGGPLRVGSFATTNSTRLLAGASFYGIMELSGNLFERTVTVGNPAGRIFTAPIHGNGLLTSDGFCDNTLWPGYDPSTFKVSGASGAGSRGGSWSDTVVLITRSRVSSRYHSNDSNPARSSANGFRAVRSAL